VFSTTKRRDYNDHSSANEQHFEPPRHADDNSLPRHSFIGAFVIFSIRTAISGGTIFNPCYGGISGM
jgi:hypothetical protein